jgi:hypothetical protein
VVLIAAGFLAVGVVTLAWPTQVQELVLRHNAPGTWRARLNPDIEWIKTPAYLRSLRVVGISSIIAGSLLLLVVIKRMLEGS